MATLNGFLRSYGAAVRRAEREQQRKAREAAKRYKEQLKLQEISDASDAVNSYNEYLDVLLSLHKNCTNKIKWSEILDSPEPDEPVNERTNYIKAKSNLENYKPSKLKSIFYKTSDKIAELEIKLEDAITLDQTIYEEKLKDYNEERLNWVEIKGIAKGVISHNTEYYLEAIKYFKPFSDIGELGTKVEVSIWNEIVDVKLLSRDNEIIPDYILNQTANGKLSKKKMPITKFNELYQDHVCSALIRVAREIFAYLPIEKSRISILIPMVSNKTGHLEDEIVISTIIVSDTLRKLNLDRIDPSDSMSNFLHNMDFSKTKGFKPVSLIDFE